MVEVRLSNGLGPLSVRSVSDRFSDTVTGPVTGSATSPVTGSATGPVSGGATGPVTGLTTGAVKWLQVEGPQEVGGGGGRLGEQSLGLLLTVK